MTFARHAKAALLSKSGRKAVGAAVRKGVKIVNPKVHAKMMKLGKRVKFYVGEGKELAKNVASTAAQGGATAAAVESGVGVVGAAPLAVGTGKAAFKTGKQVSKLVPEIRKDIAAVKRDLPAAKKFLRRKGREIKHSLSNIGGGSKPKISAEAMSRLSR